ncbi:MAG: fused response regulator/phosphatase [Pseudomonadota bacterium]
MASPIQSQLSVDPSENNAAGLRRRVLIVDDSAMQRKILSSSVKRWGYDVFQAESGDAAIALCRDMHFDLVLSDWMMPGMTGLEFCDAFRKLPDEQYGYFILLTSKSEKNEIAMGLEAGADDFLTKPVDGNELRARIAAGERILEMQRELTDKNAVISETLGELQRVYDSIDTDLREAKKLQQSLIPVRQKTFPQGNLTLMLQSAGHVGGDLVGFFQGQSDHLGLYSIDVSGHGISSALMTARLAGYLSGSAPDQNVALRKTEDGSFAILPPVEVVETLNRLILNEMDTEHYFTVLIADVDLKTGHVQMAQAGHPHPVIQRANGDIEQDGPGGFPVGLLPDVEFVGFEAQLNPGDRLLMLSDGVVECPTVDGALLEEQGLATIIHELATVRGQAFFDSLLWKLDSFAGSRGFPDDVSGILFEFNSDGSNDLDCA